MPNNHTTALTIIDHIEKTGEIVLRGAAALSALHEAVTSLREAIGLELVFDPESDPQLVDYLVTAGMGATKGAVAGGLLGLLLGALFRNPAAGAALGAAIGGVAGAAEGAARADRGWRIRAVYDRTGQPLIEVEVLDG
jgi:hypothetical protein